MNLKLYFLGLFLVGFAATSVAQTPIKVIQDDDLLEGVDYTWSSDTIYQLDGFVYLDSLASLTIEAGTVIWGQETPTTGDNASALIISRGATITAIGTAEEPIIFTAETDDLSDPDDFTPFDRGLWGGLIILGEGVLGADTPVQAIEGIPAGEVRALYGGDDDTDNSGTLRYVSIRHGGAALAEGDEINGLTLGGVGSGTDISFVEVYANLDDGIEWFGGAVSVNYASVAFCGDDSFDWDQGWRGGGQFWFAFAGEDAGDHGAEMDGAQPDDNARFSKPNVYNATYIGSGVGTSGGAINEHAMLFRDGTGGFYGNSIITDYKSFAIQVEETGDDFDSRSKLEADSLGLFNNIFFGFGNLGADTTFASIINPTDTGGDVTFLATHLTDNSNLIVDPQLTSISREADSLLDPRPNLGPAYTTDRADIPEGFTNVIYKGAFCNDGVWIQGWTALAQEGVLDPSIPFVGAACDEFIPIAGSVIIQDDDLLPGEDYTWSSDTIYILDGFVYLESGATLTIEAGTVIEGKEDPTTGDLASTLIVSRGATITAIGTATQPIIFTAEGDDLSDPDDFTPFDRGLWGGLIILGEGVLGADTPEQAIEGIPAGETRALYGGSDDADNSGTLRYVSIRHGGAALAEGDEINGLTLGGVGSGTDISFVEVYANLDDGIEWFGGTVDVNYASVAYCGDDAFDWDQGWQGNGQFWFALAGEDAGDHGAEMDGAQPDDNARYSSPTVYNATYIGSGAGTTGGAINEHAVLFRDGTAGVYGNSIITDYKSFAIQVEETGDAFDSKSKLENGELRLMQNLWWEFGTGNTLETIINPTSQGGDITFLVNHLDTAGNQIVDPQLGMISREPLGMLDPRPNLGPAYTTPRAATPEGFSNVAFKGAFCNDGVWIQGWTAVAQEGVLDPDIPFAGAGCDEVVPIAGSRIILDDDLLPGQSYTWSADTIYILDGFVFLDTLASLTIQPGTIIKGKEDPTTGDLASTLIVSRGATINAVGTATQPIIFTAEEDDTDDPNDLTPFDRGLWGGLIILGEGVLGATTPIQGIEGIPVGEIRALYGGTDDADNSGTLRYVSIRHGGAALAEGDEINGLTLGGVGSGTDISYVEVYANLDDGIEWFGGTVDVKYASVSYCGDDAFDWDQGWQGRGQYWFALAGEDAGDHGAEMDGAQPDDNERYSSPVVFNATYIGSGAGTTGGAINEHAVLFRDGTAGFYGNSIITDYKSFAIQVEDRGQDFDSRSKLEGGELTLRSNLWWSFGTGSTLEDIINPTPTDDGGDGTIQFLVDHLTANNNQLVDPQITGISRLPVGGLDPRPAADGPAYNTELTGSPDDGFFDKIGYKGAFCDDGVWIAGWTALAQEGVLDPSVPSQTGVCDEVTNVVAREGFANGYVLKAAVPNPVDNQAIIGFEMPETNRVTMRLYNLYGQAIAEWVSNENFQAGSHNVTVNLGNVPNGTYIYTLETQDAIVTRKLVVRH